MALKDVEFVEIQDRLYDELRTVEGMIDYWRTMRLDDGLSPTAERKINQMIDIWRNVQREIYSKFKNL